LAHLNEQRADHIDVSYVELAGELVEMFAKLGTHQGEDHHSLLLTRLLENGRQATSVSHAPFESEPDFVVWELKEGGPRCAFSRLTGRVTNDVDDLRVHRRRLEAATQLAPVHAIDAAAVLGLALCIAPSGFVALPGTVAVYQVKIHSLLLGPVSTT
jgi:hypothetical protein